MGLFHRTDSKAPSTRIATFAAALWAVSLFLPALVGNGGRGLSGMPILMLGWLGLNLAWFSNVFFLWALLRITRGRRPALSLAWIAILLSLDTWRVWRVPVDEGGTSIMVKGYGWGVVLWISALLLLGIAAGLRNVELARELSAQQGRDGEPESEPEGEFAPPPNPGRAGATSVRILGAVLLLFVLGTTTAAIWQRAVAPPEQRHTFHLIFFKRL